MANLASLIREAERMRDSVRVVGPEADSSEGEEEIEETHVPSLFQQASFRERLLTLADGTPSEEAQPIPADRSFSLPEGMALNERHDASDATQSSQQIVHLTEDQLEALRSAMTPPPEIMTLGEAATYLRVGRSSIMEFVKEEGLPAIKLAGKWRFKRSALDRWLETRLSLPH